MTVRINGSTGYTNGDNIKLKLGASDDLQIYHDGSHSYISDSGTGNLYIQGQQYIAIEDTDGNNYILCTDSNEVRLYHNGTEKIRTASTGIDVTGTVTADGLTVSQSSPTITITDTDGSTNTTLKTVGSNSELSNPSGGNLRFRTNATELERMRISPDGDISFYEDTGTTARFFWDASAESLGIGTTNPAYRLDIVDAGGDQLRLYAADVSTTAQADIDFWYLDGGGTGYQNGQISCVASGNAGNGNLVFYTRPTSGSLTERMRIVSDGKVGINATSPAGQLTIGNASSAMQYGLVMHNNGSTDLVMYMAAAGYDTKHIGVDVSTNSFYIGRDTSQTDLVINSSGKVGIGTGTPSYKLEVEGGMSKFNNTTSHAVYANGKSDGDWVMRVHDQRTDTVQGGMVLFTRYTYGTVGSITCTTSSVSYNTSSDYRLKENVVDMDNAIDRVKALQPRRFNWIADEDDTTVDGFIAHEVSDVVPEAIYGEKDATREEEYEVTPAVLDDDGNVTTEAVMGTRTVPDYQGIDQSKLVPLLTGALQEAIAKIEALETRIEALENS